MKRSVLEALRDAGFEDPHREARRLVATALEDDAIASLARDEVVLNAQQLRRIRAALARRLKREPLSRIAGHRDFYGRSFTVTPATLDPRPESETIIDAVKEIAVEESWQTRPLQVLDVGTGSGCLLLTLLAEFPRAQGLGTDISAEALAIAEDNARRLGLAARARFGERRSLTGLHEVFDLVVSNPPYIASGEIAGLAPEVRDWDPRAALDGGEDGLEVYRELAPHLSLVVPRGWAFFEVGAGQADAVCEILVRLHFGLRPPHMRQWKDLGGHTRCVAMKTHS
jgi:release factor glutamine methyltransferase